MFIYDNDNNKIDMKNNNKKKTRMLLTGIVCRQETKTKSYAKIMLVGRNWEWKITYSFGERNGVKEIDKGKHCP